MRSVWTSFFCSFISSATLVAVATIGAITAASASSGERPGRTTRMSHCSPERLSAGTRPARMNEDLPTPELPTTAISGRSRIRVTIAAISRLRPKNLAASFSWNDARPAYGLSSILSSVVRRPGRNGSSACSISLALCQRWSLCLSRQRSTTWISSRGTSGGAASCIDGIGSSSIAVTTSWLPSSGASGCLPVIMRCSSTPHAQMSVR